MNEGRPVRAAALSALARRRRRQLLNPLSPKRLDGEFKPGDRIKVTADGDGLVFKAK